MSSYETSLKLYDEIEANMAELIQTIHMSYAQLNTMILKYISTAQQKKAVIDRHGHGASAAIIDSLTLLKNEVEQLTQLENKVHHLKYFNSFLKNDIKSLQDKNAHDSFHFFANNQEQVVSICLGQLKLVRKEYLAVLQKIGDRIFSLWFDRSIASIINIFLFKQDKIAVPFEKVYRQIEMCFTEVFYMCQEANHQENDFQIGVLRRIFYSRFSLPTEVQVMNELLPGKLIN